MASRLRIGLTGGIASGKSTVAALFAARGVPVIDADQVARDVIAPGTALLQQVLAAFTPLAAARYHAPLLRPDGTLDRALLRRVVFDDAAQRQRLEALLHPAIRARTQALVQALDAPYHLEVNPLLVETGAREHYDRVLLVDCPPALQLERLQQRDHVDEARAHSMLAAQADRARRLAAADDVIVNDAGQAALADAVASLHQRYLALAQASA